LLGEYLKSHREKLNLTINDIASVTKISPKYLLCIEQDNFKSLPGELFARGFIKEYAKAVSLNPEEAIRLYEEAVKPVVPVDATPIKTENNSKSVLYIAGALIVLAVVVFLVYTYPISEAPKAEISKSEEPKSEVPKSEVPKIEVPKIETPKIEVIKSNENIQKSEDMTDEKPDLQKPIPPDIKSVKLEPLKQLKHQSQESGKTQTLKPLKHQAQKSEESEETDTLKPANSDSSISEKQDEIIPETKTIKAKNNNKLSKETVNDESNIEVTSKHELTITSQSDTWIFVRLDNKKSYNLTLKPGQSKTWNAKHFFVKTGNAGGINITFDGKELGVIGKDSEVKTITLPEKPNN
jgi:cytoskeletal protein RodZ